MIDSKKFFFFFLNGEVNTYENIRKMASGQWDVYTPGYFLDYSYFKQIAKWLQ